jgi:hypothetical protein
VVSGVLVASAEPGLDPAGPPGPVSVSALSALDTAGPEESALTAAIAGLAAGVAGTQAANASFLAELVAGRGGRRPDPAMPAALLPSEEPPF